MAQLATQTIVPTGLVATLAAAAGGGDTFTPDKDTYLEVNNGSGGALTVTVAIPATYRGKTITAQAVSVAAGARARIGPFPSEVYADPVTGLASITYPGGVTSLTIAACKVQEY